MTGINSGTVLGRLGRDMEVKYSNNGFAIGKFSIANTQSRKVGDAWEEHTHWFDCTLLGKRAEALSQYMLKGTQVVVQYTLQQEKWKTKEDENRSKLSLLVNDINLVGGKSGSGESGSDSWGGSDVSSDSGFDDSVPF